ncbi:glycoside hydrolase family 73 protein [Companilactobacillus hulinensis]|uniref:glycoside hydrolase family 73 protein n=1 Tax=Companilactobacillus hulinensis TaxID=2486007 RepID=UPI000F77A59D|nr:glucosaminidase domain-containing protein [Companilactobacillus hulinensis]
MNKRALLTSVAVLNTVAAVAAPTVVSAADTSEPDSKQGDSSTVDGNNVLVGPKVKEADTTVAHSPIVEAPVESSALQQIIVESANNYASPAQQHAFLYKAVPLAQRAASQYNVYTSVMLAQAILESSWGLSTLATDANNLFGIKGDYNGSTYTVQTREWSADKGYYYITANFRKYASYYESFQDNGNKLRNGLTYNSAFYSGTWKENTSSYRDATAWLQGRYATAPNYASVLNNIIDSYNLTQYDDDQPATNETQNTNTNNTNTDNSAETNGGSTNEVQEEGNVHVNVTPYAPLQDNNGKAVKNRALGSDTDWYYNKTKTDSNGTTWYHVATSEWVSASSVYVK